MAASEEQINELIVTLRELVEGLKLDRLESSKTPVSVGDTSDEARRKMERVVPTAKTTGKPTEVVKKTPEITIAGYSPTALKARQEETRDKDGWLKKEEKKGKGWLEKIFSPGMLILLGGLAALVTGFLSFKDGIAEFLGDLGSGGFGKIMDLLLNTLDLRRIPIVGGIISFVDAYQAFKTGKWGIALGHVFSGLVNTVGWAVLGPFAGMISWGIDMFVAFLEGEGEGEEAKESKGFDIWENIGKPMWDFLAPIIKLIPIIGSFVWFSEAITAFEQGGIKGFSVGLLSLVGGLAVNFPAFGTLANIGVQLLIGIIKGEGDEPKQGKGWNLIDDLAMPIYKFLSPVLRLLPIIGSFIWGAEAVGSFSKGNWVLGLTQVAGAIAVSFPWMGTAIAAGLQVMISLFDTDEAKEPVKAPKQKSFWTGMKDGILRTARKWWKKVGNKWGGSGMKYVMRKMFPDFCKILDDSPSAEISEESEILGAMDSDHAVKNIPSRPDNTLPFTSGDLDKMSTSKLHSLLKYQRWGSRDQKQIEDAISRQAPDARADLDIEQDIKDSQKAKGKKGNTLKSMVLGVFDTFDELLNQLTGGDNDSKSKLDREQEELKEREA